MKVLVPIDVLSKAEIKAVKDAILDNAWSDDVEFYLFNVIENGSDVHALEQRVRKLSQVMRELEAKMPKVPFFMEVMRGDLQETVANWLNEQPHSTVLTTRPMHPRAGRWASTDSHAPNR